MNKKPNDKRKFSGDRVLAKCQIQFHKADPFDYHDNIKNGYMVLNVRGGCLYIAEKLTDENIKKIFPDGDTGFFTKLSLFTDDKPEIVIENIMLKFLRIREGDNLAGMVFRFVELTDDHMDMLESLKDNLTVIGSSEEASIPIDEIKNLDKDDDFELE